ncbi:hypothetical protein C8J57DRAFT_1223961 [Mycena rebaudengoi]|nr:hypothetical protein C8J57DRAFT_1223961 [Mycena rebaudengoi]
MDIKFIGSGASVKAILYYITDYITKSQLKTHVAFSMLELAVKKLGVVDPFETDLTVRAKQMLRKCAYAMISQQELSAQQVASYLMDFEDHFTSHSYRNLYWTSFETFIDKELPSPECYPPKNPKKEPQPTEEPDGLPVDPSDHNDTDSDTDSDSDDDSDDEDTNNSPFLSDLVEPGQDTIDSDDDNQEIHVAVDGTGKLVPAGSQLADYQKRGEELNDTCVWDFISHVDKVKKTSDRCKHKPNTDEEMDVDGDDDQIGDLEEGIVLDDDAIEEKPDHSKSSVMHYDSRKRPRVSLQTGHEQAKTHILCVRAPDDILIPVPIGPETAMIRLVKPVDVGLGDKTAGHGGNIRIRKQNKQEQHRSKYKQEDHPANGLGAPVAVFGDGDFPCQSRGIAIIAVRAVRVVIVAIIEAPLIHIHI